MPDTFAASSAASSLVPPASTKHIRPSTPFEPFPPEALEHSLAKRFELQARRHPDRAAVKDQHHTVTYAELNQVADQIAHATNQACADVAGVVALLLGQGSEAIAAMLGVWKAGRACVILDPAQPPARLAYVLEDSQAGCVITATLYLRVLADLPLGTRPVLNMDSLKARCSRENLQVPIVPDALACLVYTSGSTGQPKGVMHTHRTILHEVMRRTNILHISHTDRVTQLSFATSQALGNIVAALLNGASLYPLSIKREGLARLSSWLRQEGITYYHGAAQIFRELVSTMTDKETFPELRLIRIASDSVYSVDVEAYKTRFSPDCLFVNGLATTETLSSCFYFLDKSANPTGPRIPVGYALDGMEILILDDAGEKLASGEVGEIAIRSRYLSPGYWRKPALTGERFLPDPAGGDARIYRTGDLGRLYTDGCLEHVGRKDWRVKVRGYSVEIPEVEAALRAIECVKDAVVVPHDVAALGSHLFAYIVPRTPTPPPSSAVLRQLLIHKIPDYMLPTAFTYLDALPLTPSGKVDRQALPPPRQGPPESSASLNVARMPVERQLLELWRRTLGVSQIGIHDDFFALGGHSLLAMQLLVRVRSLFHVDIPLAVLAAQPTVAALAQAITAPGGISVPPLLLPYKPYGTGIPFFCVHGVELFARHMEPEQPFYALHPHGMDGHLAPPSVEEMAAEYLQALRLRQPAGPYLLGGYSFGGLIAFEMAQQLRRQGDDVRLLVLLDSGGPEESVARERAGLRRIKERLYQLWARGCEAYVRIVGPVPLSLRLPYHLGRCYRARRAYRPQVYPGRLTLLRTVENPRYPLERWRGLGAEGVDIQEIPGNHASMIQEPLVQQVVSTLNKLLRRAQEDLSKRGE